MVEAVPGGAYIVDGDGTLTEMSQAAYDSEDMLQGLLANYPDLLAGDQMDPEAPRRWLLVAREKSVPGDTDGPTRWSLDHLFVDQDAVPTLVEVKRATDARLRREVVGQMLDYAANATAYWSVAEVIGAFEEGCRRRGEDSAETLVRFLGDEEQAGTFWDRFVTNLRAGRVRLVFVADAIPPELLRVIEFLNEHMEPTEVRALEIRQFVGQGLKALFPRVLGQTARELRPRTRQKWDRVRLIAELTRRNGDECATVAAKLLEWAETRRLRIWWGEGQRDGSLVAICDHNGATHILFAVWTYGRVELQFQHMRERPLADERTRRELQARLNRINGVAIPDDALERRPSFPLGLLAEDKGFQQFTSAFEWVLDTIRAEERDAP